MKQGQTRKAKLQESVNGIPSVIGRMVTHVQGARKDTLVIETARKIGVLATSSRKPASESERQILSLRAIHAWCAAHFEYVDDPENVEVIQTPNRMLRALKIPLALQTAMWEPIGKVLGGRMPAPKICGDSDEASTLVMSLAAAIGIGPLRFQLGGHWDTVHYAWGAAKVGGKWYDLDILVNKFNTHGDVEPMGHIDIPL